VRYGFVIDQRRCIGCHACTVACKEENQVPLGVFRTWVKYVERGTFPATRRFFAVLRCNHCERAPCVEICPTAALHHRPDGIVDLDGALCIGCKACMQACPYDALALDPATGTATKCHYCAHRVEVGLEPACVVVCPEQAIVAGDLDDPGSPLARLVATQPVQVRKPEQGTRPKVFYVGADAAALTPALQDSPAAYLWAERPRAERDLLELALAAGASGTNGTQGRIVYDAPRMVRPWGAKVALYLWTKSVSAGTLLLAALGVLTGAAGGGWLSGRVAPALALAFLGLTVGLLVWDLRRPERFLALLTHPNPRSWLVRGAWVLLAFGAVSALWLGAGVAGAGRLLWGLAPLAALLALGAAGYSAWLFAQAEGRDFWQSGLHLPVLLASAAVAGAAALVLAELGGRGDPAVVERLGHVLAGALLAQGIGVGADLSVAHPSSDGARAARLVVSPRGPLGRAFWLGTVFAGTVVPWLLLGVGTGPWGTGTAAVLALAGLAAWEHVWVTAGQAVPLS
jgi:Fe-S-cluster-containing dehydrogenase component/formate-dependent nitrite reductase membrane component NrfD